MVASLRAACSPRLILLAAFHAWLFHASSLARADSPRFADADMFEKQIRPLLAEKCWSCHGNGTKLKGGLRLTTRSDVIKGGDSGAAAVSGKPDQSLLIQAIRYDGEPRMPPNQKLKDSEIGALTRWVEIGLPWPNEQASSAVPHSVGQAGRLSDEQRAFWSFQPVRRRPLPKVRDESWVRTPSDAFILAALEARGIQPASPADKRTLLRRATFDLTGMPPAPEEIHAFQADDGPGAFAKVVDRLLTSPRYGERWGRHWLDLVRYADARDLIQLPAESDFREIWRYRDWVVDAFNHDVPYHEFIRHQIAGDLLPPDTSGGINKGGLIATGLLALADFVPGDVDKEQMIADYVNDQIDVVGRTFLGLSIACARCHDHKFDPISTEDYYALAGIFFSTRLIPAPVPGNTPLVRVPLVPAAELAKLQAEDVEAKHRRDALEQRLPDEADRAYLASLKPLVGKRTADYLVTASEARRSGAKTGDRRLAELARQKRVDEAVLSGWIKFLDGVETGEIPVAHPFFERVARKSESGDALPRGAASLQEQLAARAGNHQSANDRDATDEALRSTLVLQLRADDPALRLDGAGRVTVWPNRADVPGSARAVGRGPVRTMAMINGRARSVLSFDGEALLESARRLTPAGTLFVIYRSVQDAGPGRRLVGWEDSDAGKHGLGLMVDPAGRLHAILRNNGSSGDVVHAQTTPGFELVTISWGPDGTALRRDTVTVGSAKAVSALSADPAITSLRIGGPGSGHAPRFRGEVAELRVYSAQLDVVPRGRVERELRTSWLEKGDAPSGPTDAIGQLYAELTSDRGPFWLGEEERRKRLPPEAHARLGQLRAELESLRKRPPLEIPQAVVVQDGGPKGTRHEGFKDAQVFLRGSPKKLGKTVARGFPPVLCRSQSPTIRAGSGRLELAEWLTGPENPLTARVIVNRVWQHHFGEGLVRTANDFGERGERPSNPELLDELASRFIESGWSIKSLHRLIMLSSAYQQSCRAGADGSSRDPENRLFGRMNRRRLESEAIRDSLFAVAGRLDETHGGPAFTDPGTPRRTLYLLTARTGLATSDFGRLFDRADPGSIVGERGQSVVAPQALFFMNDPLVADAARALAARLIRDAPTDITARIQRLYVLALGRPPTGAELAIGQRLLTSDSLERYCQVILSTNEFLYVE